MMMLDPNTVQVLFADLQPQMVARSKTNTPDALARSAAVLAQVARLLHLPMHLSVVPEGWERPELIPELARETEGMAQHLRMSASPFLDGNRSLRRDQLGAGLARAMGTEGVVQ